MRALLLLTTILSVSTFANDPLRSLQWGNQNNGQPVFRSTGELTREFIRGVKGEDVDFPRDAKFGNKKVIVAVIDSGVDIEHPDLKENIWTNPKCLDQKDDEEPAEDCHGWNFLDGNNDLTDDIGHGTHVAGIIAGVGGNRIGIEGIASKNTKIMPLKILNSKVNTFVYEKRVITNIIADAIAYAIKNGATVINLSLGWPKLIHTKKVRFAIDKAISSNIPVIVASGNNNKKIPVFPCSYKGVICVGAMDNKGQIPEFSNFGGKVDIVAPGEGIISTYPRNLESRLLRIPGYEFKKGSSQAAPFVSGLVALLKSRSPDLSLDEIKYKIFKSAKDIDSVDKRVKFGKISLKSMLETKIESGLANFDFKSLTEVVVKENGKFKISLPVRALAKDIESLDFKVRIGSVDNPVYEKEFTGIKVLQKKERNILISGEIKDFSISSHIPLTIELSDDKLLHELAFVREIQNVENKITLKSDLAAKNLITIKSGRKFTRLRKIVSTNHESSSFDYFYDLPSEENLSKIQILKVRAEETSSNVISIPKVSKVLNLIKNDFNMDGKSDYMVYSLGPNKLNLVLSFLDEEGNPLYGDQSNWNLPISDFEGLPFYNGDIKFSYLKVNSDVFGSIKVPAFMKTWKMPEVDNTQDPLDRIPADAPVKRPYYLTPIIKDGIVELQIRTIASFDLTTKLRRMLQVEQRDDLYFDTIVDQNYITSKKGQLSVIVVTGREFAKNYYEVTFDSSDKYKVSKIDLWGKSLESNKTLISSDKNSFERASFALLDRQHLRAQFWNNNSVGEGLVFDTKSWGDLIIDVLNFSTESADKALFVETRYFVHLTTTSGLSTKLPINRESSFPGVNFSETIKNIKVGNDGVSESALLIDSSLIYGDRLYAMVHSGDTFSSPISTSFRIPTNCKHIDTLNTNESSTLFLTCLSRDRSATIELVELKK
jgi:hypothetical protein